MFKKTITMFIILFVLVVSLAACSNTEAQSVEPNIVQQEVTQPLVAVSNESVVETAVTTVETSEKETAVTTTSLTFPIVDTGQGLCYDGTERIDCPAEGEAFYGQDAQYTGITPSYTDNGDGTITDNVTGLVWTQEISSYAMPWSDAAGYCESLETGNVTDWRLPSVKELWSLRDYSQGWPWIDTDYFHLVGDGSDLAQHHSWTNNLYLVESDYQNQQVEGDPAWIVNDWTGHIKAMSGSRFVRCVSGDEYGINDFVDNGDGTVTDNATGLMWSQDDNGEALYWEEALAYAENATIAGYDDWRLPSAKELQSIADYTATEIPVLDTSVFNLTEVTTTVYDGDEVIDTQVNYPFYWTNTSNPLEADGDDVDGGTIYAWALASGYNVDMAGYDLHGAGSIVFISKTEENSGAEDVVPVMVRLVRGGDVTETPDGDPTTVNPDRVIVFEDGDTGLERGGQGGQMPDFAAAAATLGITEEELVAALGDASQGPPDFEAVAATLGITAEELESALMSNSSAPTDTAPPSGQSADTSSYPAPPADNQQGDTAGQQAAPGGQQGGPGGQPMIDLAAAAETLGVTEEALIAAMGEPGQGAPDFAAIAATLGVTEADLMAALGMVEGGMPPGGGMPSGGQPPARQP